MRGALRRVSQVREGSTINSMGVLDIFGFEIFETNSFEQLCINLANEKLQYHFNSHIFLLEQKAYEEEQLNIDKISFSDNKGCLELCEKKCTGILPMIDEENNVPKGSDDSLLQKLIGTHAKNRFFKRGKARDTFIVNHYAGGVACVLSALCTKRVALATCLSALRHHCRARKYRTNFGLSRCTPRPITVSQVQHQQLPG